MILAADSSVQIAYIVLAGALAAPIITGIFGVVTAVVNKRTNEDTTDKIQRSSQRVSSFEDLAHRWQEAEQARERAEAEAERVQAKADHRLAVIRSLRGQLIEAGLTPREEAQ